jgi:hypothetical protein
VRGTDERAGVDGQRHEREFPCVTVPAGVAVEPSPEEREPAPQTRPEQRF